MDERKMKKTLFIFLLFMIIYPFGTIQLYGQDYLNIKYADGSYKYSLVSEVSEITFNAGGTEMTVTKTDASSITNALNTVSEMTFDASILGGGSPLPVELVSFTAELNKNDVLLLWTTATEVNNYGFEVQRKIINSKFQIKNWIKIGFDAGHGNSNSPEEYSYTDKEPLGGSKFDYRLKQIDVDGNYEYSHVITVKVTPGQFSLKQNYPNPFNPTTVIRYAIPKDGYVTLIIYDMLGRKVQTLVNEKQSAGRYKETFNASALASGVYFCRIIAGNYTGLIKMLLLR